MVPMTRGARGGKRGTSASRTHLTHQEFETVRRPLCRLISKQSKKWGSHGWAVTGSLKKLRIEIAVSKTLLRPATPIGHIALPKPLTGSLKLAVRSSLDGLSISAPSASPASLSSLANAVAEPFAPGSRIVVASQPLQRAGVACFVVADDTTYLVTCGHVFMQGAVGTAVYANGKYVAKLTRNFLDDTDQLDAAYCELLPAGLQLLEASKAAPTFYGDVLKPSSGQNKDAVFWPTNVAASDAITTSINSYSACDATMFNEFWSLDLCALVRTEQITVPGDSGSLLACGDRYYASCTGAPNWSYYTPLYSTIERMKTIFTRVELWQPG